MSTLVDQDVRRLSWKWVLVQTDKIEQTTKEFLNYVP